MAVCSICGKVEVLNDPVPENPSMTFEEAIDKLNSIGCTSFVICSDCAKKYVRKVSTQSDKYESNSRNLHTPL